MKIHFDNVSRSGTGPGTFAHRLARRFFESGHEVVTSSEGADVSLVFIERSGAPLAPKVVQRLDGIWFKPDEFITKNAGIRSLYEKADSVVWQSCFDREMSIKHFGLRIRNINRRWCAQPGPGHDTVIGNGIELKPVTELTFKPLIDIRAHYKRVYVCSSNWHPQKRLAANVELFHKLQKKEPNSCLLILGNNPDVRVSGPHVSYTGHVGPEVYNQIYSMANWMLHLAWADHCPNVVIEALAQGTPVVCSDVGGTKELVGNYGVVLKEQQYDLELADYDNPPDIDLSQVDDLPDRNTLDYTSIADIDINHVAQKYIELFDSLIVQ